MHAAFICPAKHVSIKAEPLECSKLMKTKKLTTPILLVDSPENSPDLVYASGFWAPDPVVLLRTAKQSWLVVSRLELVRAQKTVKNVRPGEVIEVLTPENLGLQGVKCREISEWASALIAHAGVRRIRVPKTFPHAVAVHLERKGVRVDVAKQALFPERAIKTPREIKHIRESQAAAVQAMRGAVELIRSASIGRNDLLCVDGKTLTAEEVQRCIHRLLLDASCMCPDVIVAGGAQGADPHEKGHGPLYAHQPIVIDIFPKHMNHGYWGDITRTVVRGRASSHLKRMYAAVKAAQAAALTKISPSVPCAAVHREAAAVLKQRGFETRMRDGHPVGFIHSTGHGVGLAIHEQPGLGTAPGNLEAGHVVTVEPGLYYPEWGGIRIEDTVAVTASGYRCLVPCEKTFEI